MKKANKKASSRNHKTENFYRKFERTARARSYRIAQNIIIKRSVKSNSSQSPNMSLGEARTHTHPDIDIDTHHVVSKHIRFRSSCDVLSHGMLWIDVDYKRKAGELRLRLSRIAKHVNKNLKTKNVCRWFGRSEYIVCLLTPIGRTMTKCVSIELNLIPSEWMRD